MYPSIQHPHLRAFMPQLQRGTIAIVAIECKYHNFFLFELNQRRKEWRATYMERRLSSFFNRCLGLDRFLRAWIARTETRKHQLQTPLFASSQGWWNPWQILNFYPPFLETWELMSSNFTFFAPCTAHALYPRCVLGRSWRAIWWRRRETGGINDGAMGYSGGGAQKGCLLF